VSIAYFNGEFVNIDERVIPIEERGHQFGDGVYEVVMVYNNTPCLLDEHLKRLANSAKLINLSLPYTLTEIKNIILEAIKRSNLSHAEVYFQVTRGIASRTHLFPDASPSFSLTVKPVREIDEKLYQTGVDTLTTADERWANCHIKSLNLLPNILAKQMAVDHGKYEAILVNNGLITEGTSTNVFVIKRDTIYTTPLTSNILAGITRQAIIKLADEANLKLVEEDFTVDFLKQGDEAFISSTTIELLPIRSVDSVTIGNGTPGVITKQLHNLYIQQYTKGAD